MEVVLYVKFIWETLKDIKDSRSKNEQEQGVY